MILSLLNAERRVSMDRIVTVTNLSENKVRAAVENMIESGLIEASGKGKDRTFILSERLYRGTRSSIQYVRQTDIDKVRYPELVLKLANTQNGVFTKHDITELLKITPSQAYAIIRQLQRNGKIELVYGGKYAKYRVVES